MGHYGKHVIDPETGLCEICDKNAIQEVRQSRRLGRYSNNENPYGQDRYIHETNGGPSGSYIRKSSLPPPSARPRRVIYEDTHQLPNPTRRIVRHQPTPPIIHRPSPRPPTIMYVDRENHVIPQYNPSTTARAVHVVHQRAQTPPPPASDIWYAGPRRQTNSGMGMIQRQPFIGRDEVYYQQPLPRNPGAHYVNVAPNVIHHPSYSSSMPVPRIYQVDGNRNQYKLEPIERRIYNEPEPNVPRRVYAKLPPGRYEPIIHSTYVNPQPLKEPPVYHIRSGANY